MEAETVLIGYDLRVGRMELRRRRDSMGAMYFLTVNGDGVLSTVNLETAWNMLTAEFPPESVEVVSSSGSMRSRRYEPAIYFDGMTDAYEAQEKDDERYARSKETVSDLLPDYHVTLRDIFDVPEDDDESTAWAELTETLACLPPDDVDDHPGVLLKGRNRASFGRTITVFNS